MIQIVLLTSCVSGISLFNRFDASAGRTNVLPFLMKYLAANTNGPSYFSSSEKSPEETSLLRFGENPGSECQTPGATGKHCGGSARSYTRYGNTSLTSV